MKKLAISILALLILCQLIPAQEKALPEAPKSENSVLFKIPTGDGIIGGEALILEAEITQFQNYQIPGLTMCCPSWRQDMELKASHIVSGNLAGDRVRVARSFGNGRSLSADFFGIGEKRRFLLNKIISPFDQCDPDQEKEPLPCYLLIGDNATTLEDEKLLKSAPLLSGNSFSPEVEEEPLWSIETNYPIWADPKLSKNGRFLLAGRAYRGVWLYAFEDKGLRNLRHFPDGEVFNFSADGKIAVIAEGSDKTILWDAEKNRKIKTIEAETYEITAIAYSPKKELLIGSSWNSLYLIDAKKEKIAREIWADENEAAKGIRKLDFTPDEDAFILNDEMAWSLSGELLRDSYQGLLIGDHLALSPDGTLFLASERNEMLALKSSESRETNALLQGHLGYTSSAAFSSDGQKIATASSDGTIRVWNLSGGQERIFVTKSSNWLMDRIEALKFVDNDKALLSLSMRGMLSKWRISDEER